MWKEAGPIPQRGGSHSVTRQSTHSLASRGPGSAASSMHGSNGARSAQGHKPKPLLLRHLSPGMSFGDVGTLNRIPRCAHALRSCAALQRGVGEGWHRSPKEPLADPSKQMEHFIPGVEGSTPRQLAN